MPEITSQNLKDYLPRDFIDPQTLARIEENLPSAKLPDSKIDEKFVAPMPKDEISSFEGLEWLRDVNLKLVCKGDPEKSQEDIFYVEKLQDLISFISDKAKAIYPHSSLPVVAMDTETTGLNTKMKIEAGILKPNTEIVGFSIAFDENNGYYIPVLHKENEYPNWDKEEVIQALTEIQDNFINVWHNAHYDMSILSINGVRLNPSNNICTYLGYRMIQYHLADHTFSLGLKPLSFRLLKRKMIEINELFGYDKKDNIEFDKLTAERAYVYASSDATNTYGIFLSLLKEEESPIKTQLTAFRIEMRSLYDTVALLDHGFPLDIDYVKKSLVNFYLKKTLMEDKFNSIAEDTFTKGEKFGIWLGTFLTNAIQNKDVLKACFERYGMTVKTVKLKNGEKTTYSAHSGVMKAIMEDGEFLSHYLDNKGSMTFAELKQLLQDIEDYRSLDHERAIFLNLYRMSVIDDRGAVWSHHLRISATSTSRYANSSVTIPRLRVTETKVQKKMSIIYKDNELKVNAQGISKHSPHYKKLKKVEVDEQTANKYNKLYERAMEALKWDLLAL